MGEPKTLDLLKTICGRNLGWELWYILIPKDVGIFEKEGRLADFINSLQLMEFDGILNAESGLWSLERANTFRGLGWKGTYRITAPNAFATTGSVQANWKRLVTDQNPARIPAELWNHRREATSVPVFQLKTVDPDLIGQWEGSGTYAGGPATFVWAIQPSAATDLLIVDSLKGTVQSKDGLPQLHPAQKKQQRVSVIAFNDHGSTTTDGKTNLKWNKLQQPQSTEPRQL